MEGGSGRILKSAQRARYAGGAATEKISFNYGKTEWTYTLMDNEIGKTLCDVKGCWSFVPQPGQFIKPY